MKFVILPLFTFFIAIVSLFINLGTINQISDFFRRPKLFLLFILLMASTSISIYYSYDNSKEKDLVIEKGENMLKHVISSINKLQENTSKGFKTLIEKLASYGYKNPEKAIIHEINESDKANKYIDILSDFKTDNIKIQYFPKDVDGNVVIKSLKELGFHVFKGKAKVKNVTTNSIWFGKKVNIIDVKKVALILLRAGVKIKVIKPFKNSGLRENLIQIGADVSVINLPTYTVDEIFSKNIFTR